MDTKQLCKGCGEPLPANAPEGLCPKCLMKIGLGSEAGNPGDSPKVRLAAAAPAEIARHFPQLEIVELLGQGGMGAVYKARQRNLDRWIALKILPLHSASDAGFAERFNREARALARLSHPNIVAVYDFGQVDGLHYLIMEYVDGLNLRQLEQAGKLSPREALQIIPQICEALQFAHDEGIVHRDIKPENVLLDKKGRVKIADFGLARILGREPESFRLTGAKDFMGTPHYMAPEQIEHPQAVDHRADIYSLGVVFYEMLTGELPLGRFAAPSKKVQVDVRLDEIVLRSLERDVELRYQHASDVKSDVETITSSARLAAANEADYETASRQVAKPAFGVFIAGILYWIIVPFTFVILWQLQTRNAGPAKAWNMVIGAGILPMIIGTLMMLAGQKMKRLEAYRFAVTACILPMALLFSRMLGLLLTGSVAISPGDLIGAPMGLWALVVLSRPEVKAAFAHVGRRIISSGSPAHTRTAATPVEFGRQLGKHLTWALPTAALILAFGILGGQLIPKGKAQKLQQRATSATRDLAELSNANAKLSDLLTQFPRNSPQVQAAQQRVDELEHRTGNTSQGFSPELEFRLVAADGDTRTAADELTDPNDRTGETKLRVLKEVLLDSSAVATAEIKDENGNEISVTLTPSAAQKFADITAANIGRRLAIVWRGRILSGPVIRTQISGPISITGNMSDPEVQVLLDLLRYKPGNAITPSAESFPK